MDGVQPTATAARSLPSHVAGRCAPVNRDETRRPSPAPLGAALPTVVEKGRGSTNMTTRDETETGGEGRQTDKETDDMTPPPPRTATDVTLGLESPAKQRSVGGRRGRGH